MTTERDIAMNLRYRCLILDHDDTVMNSTVEANYPNMCRILEILRPGDKDLSLEEFIEGNSHGFGVWAPRRWGFTPEEMTWQYEFWRQNVMDHRPTMIEGMAEFLTDYHRAGGIICVSSHSYRDMIEKDYLAGCGFLPDYISSLDEPKELCKPSPHAVEEAMRRFGLEKKDILVVDDLDTGHSMARAAGVDAAAAFWCITTPKVEAQLTATAAYAFHRVEELRQLIFG